MPVKILERGKNKAYQVVSIENLLVTRSTQFPTAIPEAIKFAAERKTVVQSVREAVIVLTELQNDDKASFNQISRTAVIFFKDGKDNYVTFDDTPDASQNIIFARAQEGYAADITGYNLVLPKNDPTVRSILNRAIAANRIVELSDKVDGELLTDESTGKFSFEGDKKVRALIGRDAATHLAKYLSMKISKNVMGVQLSTLSSLEKLGLDKDRVIVRPMQVNERTWPPPFYLFSDISWQRTGYARGTYRPTEFHRNA